MLKTKEHDIKEAAMNDETVNEVMTDIYQSIGLPDWLSKAYPVVLYHENGEDYRGIYLEGSPEGAEKYAVPVGGGYVYPSENFEGYFFPEGNSSPSQGKIIALEEE